MGRKAGRNETFGHCRRPVLRLFHWGRFQTKTPMNSRLYESTGGKRALNRHFQLPACEAA